MAPESLYEGTLAEQNWERLMLQGTVLFEQDDVVGALVSFEQACILASSLPDHWDKIEDALTAVVVSHLSYAQVLGRACRIEDAAATLCAVHDRLLQAASDVALTLPARQSALRHLRETSAALLRFELMHGMRSDMQDRLREAWNCASLAGAGQPLPMALH